MTEQQTQHSAGEVKLAAHCRTSLFAGKRLIASCGGYSSNATGEDAHGENEANARRVAACWNACLRISTEALEGGLVKELVEALQAINEFSDVQDRGSDSGGWQSEELEEAFRKVAAALARAKAVAGVV